MSQKKIKRFSRYDVYSYNDGERLISDCLGSEIVALAKDQNFTIKFSPQDNWLVISRFGKTLFYLLETHDPVAILNERAEWEGAGTKGGS